MKTGADSAEEVITSPPRKDRLSDRRKKLRSLATASEAPTSSADNSEINKAEARQDATATYREKRIALAKAVHGKNYHQSEPSTPEESKKTASLNEKRLKALARVKRSPIQGASPSSNQEEEEEEENKPFDEPQPQKESDPYMNKIHRWNSRHSKHSGKKATTEVHVPASSPNQQPRLRLAASPQPDEVMMKSQTETVDPISSAHRRYKQQTAATSSRPTPDEHKVVVTAEPEEGRKTPSLDFYRYNSKIHRHKEQGRKTPEPEEGRKTPADYYQRYHQDTPPEEGRKNRRYHHKDRSSVDSGRKTPVDSGRKTPVDNGRQTPEPHKVVASPYEGRRTPVDFYNRGQKDRQTPVDGRNTPVDGRETPVDGRNTPVEPWRSVSVRPQKDSQEGRQTPIERYRYRARQEVKKDQQPHDSKQQSADRRQQTEVVPWEEAEQMAAAEERCTIETPDKVSVSNMKAKFMSPSTASGGKGSPRSYQKKFSAERNFKSRSIEKVKDKEVEEQHPHEEIESRATIETPDKVSVSSMADRFKSPNFGNSKSSKTPYNTPNTATPPQPKRAVRTDTSTPQGPTPPGMNGKVWRRAPSPNTATPSWLSRRVPSEELASESTEEEESGPKDRSAPVPRPKSPARNQRLRTEARAYAERYNKSPGLSQRPKSPSIPDRPKSPGHPRRPKSPHAQRPAPILSKNVDDFPQPHKSPSQVERMSRARQPPPSQRDRSLNSSNVDSSEMVEESNSSKAEEYDVSADVAHTASLPDKETGITRSEDKVDQAPEDVGSGHPPLSPKGLTSIETVDQWLADRYSAEANTAACSASPRRARERPWNKDLQTLSPESWQKHPNSASPRTRDHPKRRASENTSRSSTTHRQIAQESVPSNTSAAEREPFEDEKKTAEDIKPPSPNSLTRMAADSIHAIDYEQAVNDFGRKSISYEEDDNSSGRRNAIPSDLPPEFQKALSNDVKPKSRASAELDQAMSITVNSAQTSNGIMFGDPKTYGAAGGDLPNTPPRVGDRAKAIAEWSGGLNARPPPTRGKPKVYPVSPNESLLDAKKTPLGFSPRESLLDANTPRTISPRESILDNASPTAMSDMAFSEVVFGDPKTYGYAGGENQNAPAPRVKDRSHAIEEWKGGLGSPTKKSDESDISAKESILDNASPTASEVVFGDPKTFGYAGGEDEKAPAPRVKDRSHAIEEWKGGLGAPPRKKGSSDSDSGSGSGRGAAAVLRFWATTSKEEVEEAHEDWKDKDPDIKEYPDSSPEKSFQGNITPASSAELAALRSWRKDDNSPAEKNKKKAVRDKSPVVEDKKADPEKSRAFKDKKKAAPQSVKELDPFSLDTVAALDQVANNKTGSSVFDPFFDDCDQADFGNGSNFFSGSASPFGSSQKPGFKPKAVEESLPHDVAAWRKRKTHSKMKPLPRIRAPPKPKIPGTPNSKADLSGNSDSFLQSGDWSFDQGVPSQEDAIHGSDSGEI